jgi:hypothetical protein
MAPHDSLYVKFHQRFEVEPAAVSLNGIAMRAVGKISRRPMARKPGASNARRGRRIREPTSTPSDSSVARTPRRRRKRWRLLAAVLVISIVGMSAATARLFIWPDQGMPTRVSAIVMLNGTGDRLGTVLRLAWQHRAPFVVISRGSTVFGHGSVCAPPIPHVKVICFDPSPATTKGEAEFVGRLARKYHWQSVALVTTTPQDTRARLRVERCFTGPVYVVTASLPWSDWPYEIAYEWAATLKALIFQRSC